MKRMIIVSDLGAARWIELPELIVISANWMQANFGPHPAKVPETPHSPGESRADRD